MSKAPIMPFYTDSYLADCHHLSTEAHGAYLLILLHTWRLGSKALPDDDAILMSVVKAKSKARWKKLRTELLPFFDLSESTWRQKKLEHVWEQVSHKIDVQSKKGKHGRAIQLSQKNTLKNNEATLATARTQAGQPINHEPVNHEPSLNKENVDMMISAIRPSPANHIESLSPLLRDSSYFMPYGGSAPAAKWRESLGLALEEAKAQLNPASQDLLQQMISRLMMHFPSVQSERNHIFSDYMNALANFPDDLLCASYQHILKHHKYHTLPKVADFISFMEPEMAHRKSTLRKIELLLQRMEGANA